LLILAYFINSLSVVASNVFNGLGNAGLGARFSSVGALISVLGYIVLTPIYGLPGAALASLLASLQVFVYQRLLHQRLGLRPVPQVGLWLRLAAAGACQVAVVWLGFDLAQGWVGLFLVGVAGWVVFYAVWFGLGLADKGDRDLVSRLVRAFQAR
jgi:O-antigen/teichoic acid export membrane protein